MSGAFSIPSDYAAHPWRAVPNSALGSARSVPTMLHPHEQRLYYWLARNAIGGDGAVVDLGSFAGGSTARLAQGLQDAGSPAAIHAYDRFTADPKAKQAHLYAHGIPPFDGEDMLPLARRLLAPWQDRLHLHRGDILQMGWSIDDGPISLLIVDAAKTPQLTDHIADAFYPHLVAGRSVVNHQDFLAWDQFWLPPHMLLLAEFFQPLAHVGKTSLLFRCIRTPTREDLQERRVAGLDAGELVALLQQSQIRYRGWGMGKRLRRMIEAVRLNPKERRHWCMTAPPRD
ncbi:class I SAM-dependent methyltransferase [Paracoccus salsus]|uniref:class I SAM-dependent methyltransferase n=1 Tax=Paracoccus salsus TaxID=2911061 RepID=UPI001F36BD63|nr:class I SAM-dependent methyltransferase [Paracoccus salsus]MCF3973617.1 class I SAM-dependent methyltransferase [Paracoccus salsus]